MPSRLETLTYFLKTYEEEYNALGPEGVAAILERGNRWPLADLLKRGGVAVFPHVHISDCGPYTAAVVSACLDTGADRILAIGVLHTFTDEMDRAKSNPKPEEEPLRGIYGHGLENKLDFWEQDHGLYGFTRLLQDAADLRGIKAPALITRYPFLTGPHPETLPGIEEIQRIAQDSVVVSTADHCHHGIGYGHSRQEAHYFDEEGLAAIRKIIEDGLSLLSAGNYAEYLTHSTKIAKSDWRDAGPLVHHLRGGLNWEVLTLVPSDFATPSIKRPLQPGAREPWSRALRWLDLFLLFLIAVFQSVGRSDYFLD